MTSTVETKGEVLTREEGYELTKGYATYFFHGKYSLLKRSRMDVEDVISTIYVHFLEKGLFEKYNSEVTSKKYFVMKSVENRMIDMCRTLHPTVLLSTPIGESKDGEELELGDIIEGRDEEELVISLLDRDALLEKLPDTTNSKVRGNSPIRGEVAMTLREIAIHLASGYTVQEIAAIYINPYNGYAVSESRIRSFIKEIREILKVALG